MLRSILFKLAFLRNSKFSTLFLPFLAKRFSRLLFWQAIVIKYGYSHFMNYVKTPEGAAHAKIVKDKLLTTMSENRSKRLKMLSGIVKTMSHHVKKIRTLINR